MGHTHLGKGPLMMANPLKAGYIRGRRLRNRGLGKIGGEKAKEINKRDREKKY